jgi:hypothetical protein
VTAPKGRAALLGALLVVAALAVVAPAGAAQDTGDDADPSAGTEGRGNLLVYSVPGLTWADLERYELPNIEAFLEQASVADLVPRSVTQRSEAGDAYLTISAGTRAEGIGPSDGEVLRTVEDPADGLVAEVFERRTGTAVTEGSVVLDWPALVRRNAAHPYDAELGALARELGAAGIAATVVGNADGTDELGVSDQTEIQRQVGLALADEAGTVARGRLGADLLTQDPAAPFGLRLDPDRVRTTVAEELAAAGDRRVLALVEASDLVRTMRYRSLVVAERYQELRSDALEASDALFGQLLEQFDPEQDSVLLVAPYTENRRLGLTVVGLAGPEVPPGYLRTATTQRSGIVSLVDVAPSILRIFGLDAPDSMEGRPFELVPDAGTLDSRVERLVALNAASLFRENLLTPTTTALVVLLAVLTSLVAMATAGRWSDRAWSWLRYVALVLLAAFPASYVARAFPLEDLGVGFYWSFLVATSLAVAALALLLLRSRGRLLPLVAVLVVMMAVLVADVTRGSELSLSAAFGYSPTGNARLYGISNYSYGQLAAAACLLAAFVASRYDDRRGRIGAVAILVGVLVVLGVPVWGSDVGGVLAFTPALLVFAAMLWGIRLRLRVLLLAGVASVAAIVAFGFLDLSRPPEQRAHLGRLFERIGNEGLEPLVSIVERKLLANLRVSTSSFWVLAIPIGLAFWAFLAYHRTGVMATLRSRLPALHAGLVAATIAAVLGSLLNDSGAIVGGVAFTVVAASLAYLATDARSPGA